MDDGPPIHASPVVSTNRQVLWDPAQRPPSPLNLTRRSPAPVPPRTCAQEASASPYGGSPYGAIPSASPVPLRRYNSVTSPAPPASALPSSSPAPKSPLLRTPSLGAPVRISAAKEQALPPMFLPPTPSEPLPIAVPLYIPPNRPPAGPAYEQRAQPQRGPGPLPRGNSGATPSAGGPAASRRAPPIPRHSSLPLAASAYPSGNYTPAVTSNASYPVLSDNLRKYPTEPAGNCVTSRNGGGRYGNGGGWGASAIQRSTSAPVADDEAWGAPREAARYGGEGEWEDGEEGEEEGEEGEDWGEELGESEMAGQGEAHCEGMRDAGGWGVNARTGGPAGGEARGWYGEESRRQLDRSYLTNHERQQQQQQQQQQHLARHLSLEPLVTENRGGQKRDGEQAHGEERGEHLQRQASDGQCLARNGGYGGRAHAERQDRQQPDRRYLDRRHADGMYVDRSEPDRERLIELRLKRVERRRQQQWHHEQQRRAAQRLQMERRQQWQLWRMQQGQLGQLGQLGQGQEQQQGWCQQQQEQQQQQQVYEAQEAERDEYEMEQQSTSPYQQNTPPYQQATSPYQQATSPYQQSTSPLQQATSPYQQTTPPYQPLSHRTRSLPQHHHSSHHSSHQPCTDHSTSNAYTNSPFPRSTCTSHLQRTASDGRGITGRVAPDQVVPGQVASGQVFVPCQMVPGEAVYNQLVPGQVLLPNQMAPAQVVPQLLPSKSLRQLKRTPELDSRAHQLAEAGQGGSRAHQQQDAHTGWAGGEGDLPDPVPSHSASSLSSPPCSPPASTGTAICHSPSSPSSPSSSSSSLVWPGGNGPDWVGRGRIGVGAADKWVACFVPQCWNRN
ncbi:hypothetical protein CLOM_g14334 [Closterium sp. NIES-68]|nr:hypothetical protein CLOM_g14334 [Closterium sp. NIES-68]GJP61679.1 hypothetical protein CLOP_g18828 [Closterium sp. NIES-67]